MNTVILLLVLTALVAWLVATWRVVFLDGLGHTAPPRSHVDDDFAPGPH